VALSTFKDLLFKISSFFPGKFFGIFKNGQKKCPKTDFAKILSPKYMFCEHKLKFMVWLPKK
jgi:hypothetical protein